MNRIGIIILEYITTGLTCHVVSVEIFKESVHYLVLAVMILVVRWLSAKVEKGIESLKKKKGEGNELL